MRIFKFLFAIFTAIILCLTISSCNDSDESGISNNSSIIGTWKSDVVEFDKEYYYETIIFKQDGTGYVEGFYSDNGKKWYYDYQNNFTYTYVEDEIFLTFSSYENGELYQENRTIMVLSPTMMVSNTGYFTYTYTKQ